MKKLVLILIAGVMISGCGGDAYIAPDITPDDPGPKPSYSEFKEASKASAAARLKKPIFSFGPISKAGGRWTMCARINSQDRHGLYSTYTPIAQFWWDDGAFVSGIMPASTLSSTCEPIPEETPFES